MLATFVTIRLEAFPEWSVQLARLPSSRCYRSDPHELEQPGLVASIAAAARDELIDGTAYAYCIGVVPA